MIRFDRVVIAILDWLRSWGHSEARNRETPRILKTRKIPNDTSPNGILQLLERPTPRAIWTWRYKPVGSNIPSDRNCEIVMCLDDLQVQVGESKLSDAEERKQARQQRKTHQITVIQKQYNLTEDGAFEVGELFTEYYSFNRKRWAVAALNDLANLVAQRWPNPKYVIHWDVEVLASVLKFSERA